MDKSEEFSGQGRLAHETDILKKVWGIVMKHLANLVYNF